MQLNEARNILGVSESSTKEEVKKAFKKLAGKFHPDNKETGNEEQFKKINEALQLIQTGKDNGPTTQQGSSHYGNPFRGGFNINIEDFINNSGSPFGSSNSKKRRIIIQKELHTTVSFRESILGCKRELRFKRDIKCKDCDGNGLKKINNGCKVCGGSGQFMRQQGNIAYISTCNSCAGSSKLESCSSCKETGVIETDVSIEVNIPAGVSAERNVLSLKNMGDYIEQGMFGDQHTDVILHVNVINDIPNLSLKDNDVITSCDISLLEALEGIKSTINTIDGKKEIEIPKLSKNKDEIVLPNLGVNRQGNQKVILNIQYPNDLNPLIDFLKSGAN